MDEQTELKTERFTREAPIVRPPRLIHYCTKDGIRQYLDVCKAKGCGHLRPLRPLDEGSCSFRSKKQKEVEKRTNGKKNVEKIEEYFSFKET